MFPLAALFDELRAVAGGERGRRVALLFAAVRLATTAAPLRVLVVVVVPGTAEGRQEFNVFDNVVINKTVASEAVVGQCTP